MYKSIYLYNTKDDLINYKYQNTLHPYFQNCSYTFTLQMSVNTDLVKNFQSITWTLNGKSPKMKATPVWWMAYMNIWTTQSSMQPYRGTRTHTSFLHMYNGSTHNCYILLTKFLRIQSVVLVSCAFLYMAAWDRPGKRWYMFTEFDSLKMTIHVGIISSSFAINTHRYRHNISQSYQPITFRFH